MSNVNWSKQAKKTITSVKHYQSRLSFIVRANQFKYFKRLLRPNRQTKVLDIGATSEETLPDSNLFDRLYSHPRNLTIATIENAAKLRRLYPKSKVIKISPKHHLPFKDKQFDIAVSWATLEHVGGYRRQANFIKEMLRVSNKIFITTPYRGCPYEPHTNCWFLHWLPLSWFRWLCRRTRREFFAKESNLNPLWVKDIRSMIPRRAKIEIKIYWMFGLLPSHLLIYSRP